MDVSAGGFQVEHLRPLPEGPLVGRLLGPGASFAFTGRTTWNLVGVPTANIRSRTGVQLSGIDPGFFTRLLQSAHVPPSLSDPLE